MKIFPNRNLPGDADNWGREVENRISGLDSKISAVSSSAQNDNRFFGGQLAVQGRQIDEQFDRTTLFLRPADLSVSGNATIEPYPRATRNFTFNAPSGGRIARVEIYVNHSNSNYGNVAIYPYLSYNSRIVSKLEWRPVSTAIPSLEYGTEAREGFGLAYVELPSDGTASFSLTVVRAGFTSASTTETLTNIRAFLTPFQRTQ